MSIGLRSSKPKSETPKSAGVAEIKLEYLDEVKPIAVNMISDF